MFFEKFVEMHRKTLPVGLFFVMLQAHSPLLKIRVHDSCVSVNFRGIFRSAILKNTCERVSRDTVSWCVSLKHVNPGKIENNFQRHG